MIHLKEIHNNSKTIEARQMHVGPLMLILLLLW